MGPKNSWKPTNQAKKNRGKNESYKRKTKGGFAEVAGGPWIFGMDCFLPSSWIVVGFVAGHEMTVFGSCLEKLVMTFDEMTVWDGKNVWMMTFLADENY